MNITAKSSKLILLKLIFLAIFFVSIILSVNAEDKSCMIEVSLVIIELKEYGKALKAFEQASKAGNLDALTALGVMHIGGIGVEQDNTKGL